MKLTVLGGSAAGPNTGAGCSGYLIEDGDSRLVVDLGPGTLPELRRHTDHRSLTGLVISHTHLDHVLDVPALRYALQYGPIRPVARTPLFVSPGATAALHSMAVAFAPEDPPEAFYRDVFVLEEFDPIRALTVGSISIAFAPTVHYVPTWAMRLQGRADGDVIGYTADTGPAAALDNVLAGCRILVAEATLLQPNEEPFSSRGHLTAEEAGELATRTGASTLLLTHLWEELGLAELRDAAARAFAGEIVVARPGVALYT